MAAPEDFLLDDNYAMYWVDGDWAFGDTNEIDADLIINTPQGQWGQSLLCGVGMRNNQNMDVSKIQLTYIEKNINQQLKADAFSAPDATLLLAAGNIVGLSVNTDRQI